ncbi:unnamed protein product [Clonostachys rosea]|uniref:F-box domain-containing protein n=1 Tax=Bionectria ochroleuca TaxID=29856 RepID=A0ABY6V2W0_BIOOC|nr:unnamed protein product [Clonostachys rosea]
MDEIIVDDLLAPPAPTPSHTHEGGSLSSRVNFLDLPQNVRDQIYQEAGCGGNKFIHLNLLTIRERDEGRFRYENSVSSTGALLFAGSHLVHDEVETKIYAENTFAVSLVNDSGLQMLENLSDTALRELRTLIVSICPGRCRNRVDRDAYHALFWLRWKSRLQAFWDSVDDRLDRDISPLNSSYKTDQSILSQWKRICARLAANSRPHQLSLSLVADVADEETAKGILDPLRGMPPLRDVAINLDLEGFDSKSFIQYAARDLVRPTVEESAFCFMNLPPELQFKILRHTSLVARGNIHIMQEKVSQPHDSVVDSCHMRRSRHRGGDDPVSQPMAGAACFCSREYPDAFSQLCKCTDCPPEDYFRVSKGFSHITRHVYYSRNKFHLHPTVNTTDRHTIATSRGDGYRLTLPLFLRRIPVDSLRSLRHLCIIFPPCSSDYLSSDQSDWHAWVESIKRLTHFADPSHLKLEIHFSDLSPARSMSSFSQSESQTALLRRHESARLRRNEIMEKAMFDTYKRILKPLGSLGHNLLSLQVFVSWPLFRGSHEERKENERSLEKMIMGDDYDSAKWGKLDQSEFCSVR